MHDYHAAEALVERVTSELGNDELTRAAEVRIRASVVFSPEALEQAYEMLTRETPLEGSRLVVEPLPDERTCAGCGSSWLVSAADIAGHVVVCPSCGALSGVEGGSGLELVAVSATRSTP